MLRHKGRKYPFITIVFTDKSPRCITIRADLKTAEKIHLKIKRQIAIGTFNIKDYGSSFTTKTTLSEFSTRYLEHREKLVQIGQLSNNTLQHDKYSLNLLLERIDNYTTLNNLTSDEGINFLVLLKDSNNKNNKPFKPGAINSYLKHLKAPFNWAVKEKLILESSFKNAGSLHNPNEGTYRFISENNIQRIRGYLQDKASWQLDIFNLCLWTRARRDEVFNIKKQSLYVDDIKGEKVPFVGLYCKSRKVKNMPLCAEACESLDRRVRYLTDLTKQFELMDRSKSPTQIKQLIESRLKQGYLFWEIMDSHSITSAFARARKALGLEYFNVHSLRHSFATYCLKDEVPVMTVKEFLGHSDIKTTMIYAKTDAELKAIDIKKHKPRSITINNLNFLDQFWST